MYFRLFQILHAVKDFLYEIDSRIEGYGYQVTDESMIPQLFNSAMGCAC